MGGDFRDFYWFDVFSCHVHDGKHIHDLCFFASVPRSEMNELLRVSTFRSVFLLANRVRALMHLLRYPDLIDGVKCAWLN